MNSFDRNMVGYVMLWTPFGGPPEEEILPQFGLTPAQLGRRFSSIVLRMIAAEDLLYESDRELLAAVRRAYPNTFEFQDSSPSATSPGTASTQTILHTGEPVP